MSRNASAPVAAHRLFFALCPDDALREAIRATVEGAHVFGGRGRRVAPAKYHVTLHFLGGWDAFPDDVAAAARRAGSAVESGAFHLVVDRAGGFARSRVGWLAPSGNSGLDALWSSLGHALDAQGVERRVAETFAPHVTVLRDVHGRLPETPVDPLSWPVEDFVLVHSHDGRYAVIDRWPLAAG